MTLAIFIIIVVVVAVLLFVAVDQPAGLDPYRGRLKALILVLAAVAIAQRAGLFSAG